MTSLRDEAERALRAGLRLSLGGTRTELARLMAWLATTFEDAGIASSTSTAVQICLDEAFANIIEHGLRVASPIVVHVGLRLTDDDRLIVGISDDGAPFDPTGVAPPIQADNLDDVRIGGLGIHFIRTLSLSMDYQRIDGSNRLTLAFPASFAPRPMRAAGAI